MINTLKKMYDLNDEYRLMLVEAHEGGRNTVYICVHAGEPKFVIRVSMTGDRKEEEYLAETELMILHSPVFAKVSLLIEEKSGKRYEKNGIISKG